MVRVLQEFRRSELEEFFLHLEYVLARGDADLAHRTKTAMCIGCHGIPGYKTAFPTVYHVPKIAGQQPAYIVNALKAYKSGERSHPSMRGIAASLTDQDIADLAAYYGVPAK